MVERRIRTWPSPRTGSRSSSARRIALMSISMWLKDGVPRVMTMCLARAASATRSDHSIAPVAQTRRRTAGAPGSSKGMRASRTAARRWGSPSTPRVRRPRSAKESASGRPTRPQPMTATSKSMGPGRLATGRAAPSRAELLQEGDHEGGVVLRVAPPEAPRLLRQAVDPLEAVLLHPRRRLRHEPGVEVEGGADADEQRRIELGPHLRHPLLLLRLARPDPDDVGLQPVDLTQDPGLLVLGERPVGRRPAADDPQARIAIEQP